jgi:GTP-binding protein Era
LTEFRSGFVAMVGRPNVGKSTLLNAVLGQKIAAVTPRPQTTRRRQMGILTTEGVQLILMDTPGIHEPKHKLGRYLNQEAEEALDGVDVVLWLVDATSAPGEGELRIASLIDSIPVQIPVVLAVNKIDLIDDAKSVSHADEYRGLVHRSVDRVDLSAIRGDGVPELVDFLAVRCPVRPAEFDDQQITDLYEREIAADLIREAALLKLRDEVPHALAVRIDEFQERQNGVAYIGATVFVERQSQKGIVIGEGGKMLKRIGTHARREIEAMGGRKVFLELRVKVEKDWRNNENVLKRLGYKLKE